MAKRQRQTEPTPDEPVVPAEETPVESVPPAEELVGEGATAEAPAEDKPVAEPTPEPAILEPPPIEPPKPFAMPSIGDLDRVKLYKFFYAMVHNHTHGRTGTPAVIEIGKIFGAKSREEEQLVWQEIKTFVLGGQANESQS